MSRASDHDHAPTAPRDMPTLLGRPADGWRARMFDVIFGTDTTAGRRFDLALVAIILLSILTVVLDSVPAIGRRYAAQMSVLEWTFTIFFTLEYIARLVCVQRPVRYARSFYGVIDLVSVLPTWISLLVPGSQVFLDVRILRLLRIFRILKLTRYVDEYTRLGEALVASKRKIMVFLSVVLMLILILGTVMYVVEGPESGFTSIPMAMYWATVTITTVGYGDITPHTTSGQGHRVVHDAARLGHPGGADGDRQRRDDVAKAVAPCTARRITYLQELRQHGPRSARAVLQGLRRGAGGRGLPRNLNHSQKKTISCRSISTNPVNGHGLPHDPFNAIVGPRPIGWISSLSAPAYATWRPTASSTPSTTCRRSSDLPASAPRTRCAMCRRRANSSGTSRPAHWPRP